MTDDLQAGPGVPELPSAEPACPLAADPATAASPTPATDPRPLQGDEPRDWSWPPYAPLEPAGGRRFDCEDWAPSSIVRRPRLRVGRWTLLYRRDA